MYPMYPEADIKIQNVYFTTSHQISFEGLPEGPEWPTKAQLKQLIVTRSGRPVSMQDIESDVFTLLSTGKKASCYVLLFSCTVTFYRFWSF